MSGLASGPIRRILLIRLSALGDVVMASGLIPALKALYPEAEITWLTQSAAAPLLQHNPRLHEVLVWPRERWQQHWRSRSWRALWGDIRSFRAELVRRRFDLVLDAQGLLKSGLCAWLTGSPRRVGLIPREASRYLVHHAVFPPAGQDVRMGAEYRFLARWLGARDEDFQPDLAVGAVPARAAERVLSELGVGDRYVVICPFTTRPQKHWFDAHWGEVIQGLAARGWQVVILGGPGDAAHADAIRKRGLLQAVSLAGRLKLDESVAVVQKAALLIGVDTGLTHMGSALNVPTLALFGSTRPYLDAGKPNSVIRYDALPCSPCGRHPTCGGTFTCMQELQPARVLSQAFALLSST